MEDVIEPKAGKILKWRIGTFDIETVPIGGRTALLGAFKQGATYVDGTVTYHDTMYDLLRYILKHKDEVRWYCHNGGGFDFKYIIVDKRCMSYLECSGYTLEVIGGSIAKALRLTQGKRSIFLCDSFKLMPSSLDKLAKSLQVETLKGKIDFDNESYDPNNAQHRLYLQNDVVSLFQVVTKYRNIIQTEFGTDIKITASSTAFECWRTCITENVYRHSEEVNTFARKGYYGGRTECMFQGYAIGANYIDVNSLYAYIMHEYGGLHRPYYTEQYIDNTATPGFFHVTANVPEYEKFGPLPYRKEDKSGIVFPVGRFQTYASSIEIDLAISRGTEVVVHQGYAFEEHDRDLHKPFIGKCMELRSRDYSGALGIAAKFLQNNLYGFFGMNPLREELVFSPICPGPEYELVIDEKTGEYIDGLWTSLQYKETANCIPAFAAWVTACARAYLLSAMYAEEDAGNTVLYCDTDSIILQGQPVSPISEGTYGDFKFEYVDADFTGITAKTYKINEVGSTPTMRCKGLPNKRMEPEFYDRALQGEKIKVPFTQLYSLARVAKTGRRGLHLPDRLGIDAMFRTMPTPDSMTSRTIGEGGWSKPHNLNDPENR